MGYKEAILIVNAACIIILLMLAGLLAAATRLRRSSAYAAAIIVGTTVPVYVYNVCRSAGWYDVALCFIPLAYSVNTLLMPLLWLFVQRNFSPRRPFRPAALLHFLPAALCLALFSARFYSLTPEGRLAYIAYENTGADNAIGSLNALVVFVQMFAYYALIFRYLHRMKDYIRRNLSDAEYLRKLWIPRFMTLTAALFLVVFVAYVLWPRTDAWLIQILNVVAMSYLVYKELPPADAPLPPAAEEEEEPAADADSAALPPASHADEAPPPGIPSDMELLRSYASRVRRYLETSGVYTNPDLSLRDVAQATGIHYNTLSRAINAVLGKNFFELINGMRIEKSKTLLMEKKKRRLTIETIAEECGFNSRFTFNDAFKKSTGMTTSQWLKSAKNG